MSDGLDKRPMSGKCVLCDREVTSLQEGWQFKNFNICYDCVERIFQDIV